MNWIKEIFLLISEIIDIIGITQGKLLNLKV